MDLLDYRQWKLNFFIKTTLTHLFTELSIVDLHPVGYSTNATIFYLFLEKIPLLVSNHNIIMAISYAIKDEVTNNVVLCKQKWIIQFIIVLLSSN